MPRPACPTPSSERLPDRRRATADVVATLEAALRPQAQRARRDRPELIGGIRAVVGDEVPTPRSRPDRTDENRACCVISLENIPAQLNPAEISERDQEPHRGFGRDGRHQEPGHGRLGGRRHSPRARPVGRDGRRNARIPAHAGRPADLRPGAQPRARLGGAVILAKVRAHLRRRHRQVHRPHPGSAGRPRADRLRRRAGRADRRQGSDQRQDDRRGSRRSRRA